MYVSSRYPATTAVVRQQTSTDVNDASNNNLLFQRADLVLVPVVAHRLEPEPALAEADRRGVRGFRSVAGAVRAGAVLAAERERRVVVRVISMR